MGKSLGKALLLWLLSVPVFVLFGGLGAGITAVLYELLFPVEFSDTLYAVVFGVNGFIACRLLLRAIDRDTTPSSS